MQSQISYVDGAGKSVPTFRYAPRHGREWTAEEREILRHRLTAHPYVDRALASRLGRSLPGTRAYVYKLRREGLLPRPSDLH